MDKEIANIDFISCAKIAVAVATPVAVGFWKMTRYILKKADQKIDGKADKSIMDERFESVSKEINNMKDSHLEIKAQLTGIDSKVTDVLFFLAENKK